MCVMGFSFSIALLYALLLTPDPLRSLVDHSRQLLTTQFPAVFTSDL